MNNLFQFQKKKNLDFKKVISSKCNTKIPAIFQILF